jgi:hypothetical protein
MADCREAAFIPPKTQREDEYRLWGQDRQALADCRALNAAKAATINAFKGGAQ